MTAFIGIFLSKEEEKQELYGIYILTPRTNRISTILQGTILLHSNFRNIADIALELYGSEFRNQIQYTLSQTQISLFEKYSLKRTLTDKERQFFDYVIEQKIKRILLPKEKYQGKEIDD